MDEEGRSFQGEEIMQDEVDAIILVHPRNCMEKILKMICGELIASFVLLSGKEHYIIAFCKSAGMVDVDIRRIINSFEVFSKEITVNRLVRGLIVPHLARKSLLLLHARFFYNLAVMLLVRSEKLLRDVISLKATLRSKRRFEQLLNLDFCFDEDEPWPTFVCIEEQPPLSPLERITDQDPGLYLLETLEKSGALEQHLLPDDEPMRPVAIEEEAPNFGMPAEIIWDTDAIINWLPEELRPSSLFGQELNEPEQVNNGRVQQALPPTPAQESEPPRPRPPPRPRRVQPADDALNRISITNHLDRFLKLTLKKRFRKRILEYKNHLKLLRENLRESNVESEDIPKDKLPCPFCPEEIAVLVRKLISLKPSARLSEPIDNQHLLGVSDITLTSNQSARGANLPQTPAVQGSEQQLITPIGLPQTDDDDDMELTFIEHMLPTADVEMLPFQYFVPENIVDESMRIEPQPVGETPQEAPPTIRPESATVADVTMLEILEPQDNVERMMQELFQEPENPALIDNEGRMMQNLFQEPENAALTVSVVVGETSFVHALPSHEVIEPEAVQQPEDNISGRLRPATARRRRLVFEGSPPSPQQPSRRKRRIRQPGEDVPAAADLGGGQVLDAHLSHPEASLPQPAPLPQPDAPLPQPDDNFDDLGVIPLSELEPQVQQAPVEDYDQESLETPQEIRKNKFVKKLKELQIKHGCLINFLQICPTESTLRAEAAFAFATLLELCHASQIDLIQEVAYAPDRLFIKLKFEERV